MDFIHRNKFQALKVNPEKTQGRDYKRSKLHFNEMLLLSSLFPYLKQWKCNHCTLMPPSGLVLFKVGECQKF